jgi:hypothetical protein
MLVCDRGIIRDGITGVLGESVDGLPNDVHLDVLTAITAVYNDVTSFAE